MLVLETLDCVIAVDGFEVVCVLRVLGFSVVIFVDAEGVKGVEVEIFPSG